MPRNTGNQGSQFDLNNAVRQLVREELKNIFAQGNRNFDDLGGESESDSTSEGRARGGRIGGQIGGRARTPSKGRVTNPNDRRLKQNREAV